MEKTNQVIDPPETWHYFRARVFFDVKEIAWHLFYIYKCTYVMWRTEFVAKKSEKPASFPFIIHIITNDIAIIEL